jgi:hypothetical protein
MSAHARAIPLPYRRVLEWPVHGSLQEDRASSSAVKQMFKPHIPNVNIIIYHFFFSGTLIL